MGHIYILSELNSLIFNLNKLNKKIILIGISKSKKEIFSKTKEKYNLKFELVNDKKGKLFNKFNYICGSCIKIILVDRKGIARYISSSFDPFFIRELVQRYNKEEVNNEKNEK